MCFTEIEVENNPRVSWSPILGPPDFIVPPEVLSLCPPAEGMNWLRLLPFDMVVKCGRNTHLQEAEAMQFVTQNTRIKVPEVIAAYTLDGETYIVMSRIFGKDFHGFLTEASDADKEQVLTSLKDGIASMRAITADYVGGFSKTHCIGAEYDWDYNDHNYKYGPYEDDAAFHEGLVEAMLRSNPLQPGGPPESRMAFYRDLVEPLKGHRTVLTHGDLHTANILVQDDLTPVILDWDTAGFYPEYWEWHKTDWHIWPRDMVPIYERFVPPFKEEDQMMTKVINQIIH